VHARLGGGGGALRAVATREVARGAGGPEEGRRGSNPGTLRSVRDIVRDMWGMGGPYCAPGDGESVGLGPHCDPGIIAGDCVGFEPHCAPVNVEGVRSGAGDGESVGLGPHCAPGIIAGDCVGFEPHCAPVNVEGVRSGAGDGESVRLGPHCDPGIIAGDCVGFEPHCAPVNGEGVRSGAGDGESVGLGPHCDPGIIAGDCVRSGSLPAGRAAGARGVDGGGRREEASQASQLRWAVALRRLRAVQDRRARQPAYGKGRGHPGKGGWGEATSVTSGPRATGRRDGRARRWTQYPQATPVPVPALPLLIWRRSRWTGCATGASFTGAGGRTRG
jgi:hypothetical protein